MRRLRWIVVSSAVLPAVVLAASPRGGNAQGTPAQTPSAPTAQNPAAQSAAKSSAERGRPSKSVYGKLERVDESLNGVIMRSDDGARLPGGSRLSWHEGRSATSSLKSKGSELTTALTCSTPVGGATTTGLARTGIHAFTCCAVNLGSGPAPLGQRTEGAAV